MSRSKQAAERHQRLYDTMNAIGEEAHQVASMVDGAFYLTPSDRTKVRGCATAMLARLEEYEGLLA